MPLFVNESKPLILDQQLANPPFDNLEMGLGTGAGTPDATWTISDITEVTGTGYARQTVSGWLTSILLADGHAYSVAPPCTFTDGGSGDWDEATMWFWWDITNSRLVAVNRFTTPFTLGVSESKNLTPVALFTGES